MAEMKRDGLENVHTEPVSPISSRLRHAVRYAASATSQSPISSATKASVRHLR